MAAEGAPRTGIPHVHLMQTQPNNTDTRLIDA